MGMFDGIEGLTEEQGVLSITQEAADQILAIIREMNPQTEATAEQILAIKDMRELFDLTGGPGRMPGGMAPEGMNGGFPGDPNGMSGPGTFPGGGFGNENAGPASADFYMNDTVNAFSGVTDEAN